MKYYMVFVCIALASFNFKSNCFPSRDADNVCEDQPNGSFLNHPLGCKYFIVCNNGEVNTGSCPDGLAFNPLRPPCDLEANVDCSVEPETESTTTESTTTQPTTTQPTTTQPTTTQSTSTTSSTTTLSPTTTTASTSTTTMPTTISTTTQSTTRPTTTSSTTAPSSTTTSRPPTTNPPPTTSPPTTTSPPPTTSPPTTTRPPTTTQRPTSTTTKSPTIPQEIECPMQEDPNQIFYLASNSHCSKYYICYHNRPIEMTCSPNLHWNIKTQKCDTVEEAKCTVSTMPSFFPVCPRDAIGIYPHPLNCEWFLYCYLGHMTVQQCPFFYHWDRETQSCQLKTVAKCVLYSE